MSGRLLPAGRTVGQNPGVPQPDAPELDRILRRLDRAVRSGDLVRVHRKACGGERIEGFVVAATPGWTLLAVCDDIQLDGWAAVRTADITKVRRTGDGNSLTVRVLRSRGEWPVPAPGPADSLHDLPALAEAACEGFGLVGLYRERQRPEACWIGEVVGRRPKSLGLLEIDPDACWYPAATKFRLKDVTRVDFGGHYQRTLREFAGPRP